MRFDVLPSTVVLIRKLTHFTQFLQMLNHATMLLGIMTLGDAVRACRISTSSSGHAKMYF